MTRILTLEVEPSRVGATLARGNRVDWRDHAALGARESLNVRLGELLARVPRTRLRPQVVVKLAFPLAQLKRVDGLPAGVRPRVLAQIVRENASAFFLRASPTFAISDVHRVADGAVWVAAYDRAMVDDVVRAVAARGWSVAYIAPAESLLSRADDEHGRATFSWNPARGSTKPRTRDRAVAAMAWAVVAAAAAAAAIGPPIRARAWESASAAELQQSAAARASIATMTAELGRVTRTLNVVRAFTAQRGTFTMLLGRLAESLPESTAIATLHVDSMEIAMVAVSPRVTDVLPALASIDSGSGPRITSTVSREVIGGVRLERAAFRLKRAKPQRRAAPPATTATTARRGQR